MDDSRKQMKLGDIPQYVRDQVSNHLLHFSVGLLRGQSAARPREVDLAGSGTLVQVNDHYAILTADHVISCLQGNEDDCEEAGAVGLVFAHPEETSEDRPVVIPMEALSPSDMVQIARDPQKREGAGPDLGAILLPYSYIPRIKEERMFYNLSEAYEDIRDDSDMKGRGVRLLFGFTGADTRWEQMGDSDIYIPNFQSNALWGGTEREPDLDEDGFDYFRFHISEQDAHKLPTDLGGAKTLGGISGGAAWHVPIMENDEPDPEVVIERSSLCGVVFGEIYLSHENRAVSVKCHGWRSVYEKVLGCLTGRLPW